MNGQGRTIFILLLYQNSNGNPVPVLKKLGKNPQIFGTNLWFLWDKTQETGRYLFCVRTLKNGAPSGKGRPFGKDFIKSENYTQIMVEIADVKD